MLSDAYYLEIAVQEAEQAGQNNTYPIGAIIVSPFGEIISRGRNTVFVTHNPTGHAELHAISQANGALYQDSLRGKCTLYTSLEPCLMCTGAIVMAQIARVVWAENDDGYGAMRRVYQTSLFNDWLTRVTYIETPIPALQTKQRTLLANWDRSRGYSQSRWYTE